MTLVEGKYFKVSTIDRIVGVRSDNSVVVESQDIKYGLSIEKRFDDGHYYVVAFIKHNDRKPDNILENVDFRTIDMIDEKMSMEDLWEMMQEYKSCVMFANQTLEDVLEKSHEENRYY